MDVACSPLRRFPVELLFWASGLLYLACINPADDGLPALCIIKAVTGWECPGCGLGSSIAYLLHGRVESAIVRHPLGLLAVPVILYRICTLLKQTLSVPQHPLKG